MFVCHSKVNVAYDGTRDCSSFFLNEEQSPKLQDSMGAFLLKTGFVTLGKEITFERWLKHV